MSVRLRLFSHLAAVFSALPALAASSEEPHSRHPTFCGQKAEWTIVYYSNGDNDLENDLITDLYEAAAVGSTPLSAAPTGKIDRHIVMLLDTRQRYVPSGSNQTFSIRVESTERVERWERKSLEALAGNVARLPEKNMADGETLRDYLADTLECYPSDKVALIINGHGSGVRAGVGRRVPTGSRAFGVDLNPPPVAPANGPPPDADVLFVAEAVGAIRNALARVHRSQLDLIGLDACLMSTIEVGYAFRTVTPLLVASENTEETSGWNHELWLTWLKGNPKASPLEVAHEITATYERALPGPAAFTRTLAATVLAEGSGSCLRLDVAGVAETLNKIGAAIVRSPEDELASALMSARGACRSFGPQSNSELTADLHCVMSGLQKQLETRRLEQKYPNILTLIETIHKSLDCAVQSKSLGDDILGQPSAGISVFLPSNLDSAQDSEVWRDRAQQSEEPTSDGFKKYPMPFFVTASDWAQLLGDARVMNAPRLP
jgi:hypothetical protein